MRTKTQMQEHQVYAARPTHRYAGSLLHTDETSALQILVQHLFDFALDAAAHR